jgi:hypothetical protein
MTARATIGRLGLLGRLLVGLLVGLLVVAPASAPATAASAATSATAPTGPVTTITDPRIVESSGLAVSPVHPDLVWTVNDSGSQPLLFGVSTRTGRTRSVVRMAGIEARDVEALAAGRDAQGRSLVWVGDIGDNRAVRDDVVLRLVREPGQVRSQSVPVTSLRVRYQHGPADAETLVWLPDGRLLIITKALLSARVYQVPPAAVRQALAGHDVTTPVLAPQVGTISQTLATDGGALPDGRLVVRGYESAAVYAWASGGSGQGSGGGFEPVAPVELPSQQQGEGIAVEPGGATVLLSSEGLRQPLYRVALPSPTATTSPSPTTSPSLASGAGQPRTDRSDVGAPSDSSRMQRGAPAPLVAAAGIAGLLAVAALGLVAVRGARRRTRRTR